MVCFLVGASSLAAQEKATITGTISDPSGSVIPGAKVTITDLGTGQARNIETNSAGSYVVTDLPIGRYSLRAESPGFKGYEQTGIVLNVGDTIRVDVPMQVGRQRRASRWKPRP